MRSHNKRQLDSVFNFLWFDQQSFKIKTSYNKNNISAHQHQINVQIITFFLHFNSSVTQKNVDQSTISAVVWIFLRYWLLSSSGGGTKVKIFQSISGKAWESSKVTQATSSSESKAGRKPTLYTSNQTALDHTHHTGKLWNSHVWHMTPNHHRKAYQPWGAVRRGAADHHQIFLHVQQRPATNVRL